MSVNKKNYVLMEILTTILTTVIMPLIFYVIWQTGLWSFNDFRLALIISFSMAGVNILVTIIVPKIHFVHRKRRHH